MNLYKLRLSLKSALATPLKGDTIWGHFAWGIANHEGEEAVEKFINDSKSSEPPLIVSSAFPINTLCKPIPEPQERVEKLTIQSYSAIKKAKKNIFCDASEYISSIDEKAATENAFSAVPCMHNTINRMTNTVIEGGLFTSTEFWPKQKEFNLYIASTYDLERIKTLALWAFENGYGADSSTGKGNITLSEDPVLVKTLKKGIKYMALAPFVLQDFSTVKNLRADTFIRSGKIGGYFSQNLIPWKKTIVMYDEGAVFESDTAITFIGTLLQNIHSDSRICHSGFAPVIPIE